MQEPEDAQAKYAVAVFPYLKTSKTVSIRGCSFFSMDDIQKLEPPKRAFIQEVLGLFYIKDGYRPTEMACCLIDATRFEGDESGTLEEFSRVRNLVCYVYSMTHLPLGTPFLSDENCVLALVLPSDEAFPLYHPDDRVTQCTKTVEIERDASGRVPGHKVHLVDFETTWVPKDGRLFPISNSVILNHSQDLSHDLPYSPAEKFSAKSFLVSEGSLDSELEKKVFTALRWFNRSSSGLGNESTELVHLAIAFESLLNLPKDGKKEGFRNSVSLLLGHVINLDEWLRQFYDSRSQIVHEGEAESVVLTLHLTGDKSGSSRARLLSLVSYGRQIFAACLDAIVAGHSSSRYFGLSSQLASNHGRWLKVHMQLDEPGPAGQKLLSLAQEADEISLFLYHSDDSLTEDSVMGAMRKVFEAYVNTNPQIPDDELDSVKQYLNAVGDDKLGALNALKSLSSREPRVIRIGATESPDAVVNSLVSSAWTLLFQTWARLAHRNRSAPVKASDEHE